MRVCCFRLLLSMQLVELHLLSFHKWNGNFSKKLRAPKEEEVYKCTYVSVF